MLSFYIFNFQYATEETFILYGGEERGGGGSMTYNIKKGVENMLEAEG